MLTSVLLTLPLAILGCRDTLDPMPRSGGLPGASVVTVTDTVLPVGDTYIRQTQANTNFGTDTALQVGGGGKNRVLVRFDSTAIRAAVGTGALDSAWVEFTIKAGPLNWGTGRNVDLHRLTKTWTEAGATWNCAIDNIPSNGSANCPSTSWDMTGNNGAYHPTKTDRVNIVASQTGVIRLNVTADVQGYLAGGFLNQGWMFRKTNEAEGGEALVLSRESGSQPRLVLYVATNAVPVAAPESLPTAIAEEIYAPGNMETNNPLMTGVYPRNVVVVVFHRSATQAQRQSAVDAIGGEVIGGMRIGTMNGAYYVRIPDDGTVGPLLAAIAYLKGLSFVAGAGIDGHEAGPLYVRPTDGASWGKSSWRLPTQPAEGENWAFEAVNAPLAWGCATGDTTTVAVIDQGFVTATDLTSNLHPQSLSELVPWASGLEAHGTAVASLIGAVGDNQQGIAGMAWQSRMLYMRVDLPVVGVVGPPSLRAAALIVSAAQSGAKVVNLSLGQNWLKNRHRRPALTGATHVADSTGIDNEFAPMRALLLAQGLATIPLIVIAAGNDSTDAWYSLYPRIAEVFPDEVIVVQASDSTDSVYVDNPPQGAMDRPASNFGSLVTIDAPGESLTVVVGGPTGGSLASASGTSVAAPMVTGAAALLWSMHPELTAAEVRTALVAGAATGGVLVSGVPRLNVYESLKSVSGQSGRPLCGNRVWAEGNSIYASRTGGPEVLYTGNGAAGYLNVYHGGRRVDFFLNGVGDVALSYSNGSWQLVSDPGSLPAGAPNATWNSLNGYSHDADSILSTTDVANGPGARLITVRLGTVFNPGRTVGSITVPIQTPTSSVCLQETAPWDSVSQRYTPYTCSNGLVGDYQVVSAARPAHAGDAALVAINRYQYTYGGLGPAAPCPGSPTDGAGNPQCRMYPPIYTVASDSVTVWRFPLSGTAPSVKWGRAGRVIHWMGVPESGTDAVIATSTFNGTTNNCQIEYVDAVGQPTGTNPVIGNAVACSARGTGGYANLRRLAANRRP